MRVSTAFSRLLDLPGVGVRAVSFEPGHVVVTVALRRRRLHCPKCSYSTRHRENKQHHDSVWRHLDLGVWRLEVHARLRRLCCPEHGALVEGVPFARDGARFTRDFENLVAWLATKTDKTATCRLTRIDWQTIGRIIARVGGELIDGDRLSDLFEISIDEVAWRKGHRYLTLVGDHRRGRVVWGCEGKGKVAADEFFEELDPPPQATPAPEPTKPPRQAPDPAIMVPFGPCPTVAAGHGIQGAWLEPGSEIEPAIFARASRLTAVSMDMTGGYAKSVRDHAPQATIVIDNYHVVQLATKALDEVRREHWNELRGAGETNAAKRFKHDRWALLKNPEDLTDQQATTLAALQAAGGKIARAWGMKELVRAIFAPGLTAAAVARLIDRLLARLSRSRLKPFVRLGRTIRKHREGILAARRLKLSNECLSYCTSWCVCGGDAVGDGAGAIMTAGSDGCGCGLLVASATVGWAVLAGVVEVGASAVDPPAGDVPSALPDLDRLGAHSELLGDLVECHHARGSESLVVGGNAAVAA